MRFAMPLNHRVLPLVIAHGFADVEKPLAMLSLYSLALVPLPATSATFALASLLHFEKDVGTAASVMLHAALFVVSRRDLRVACVLLQAFFCAVHVPLVLCALVRERRWLGLSFVAAAVAAASKTVQKIAPGGEFVLTEWMQRLVTVHVFLNIENAS